MISLNKFKELLAEDGIKMSDEEAEKLRESMHGFANLAFEAWQKEKIKNK